MPAARKLLAILLTAVGLFSSSCRPDDAGPDHAELRFDAPPLSYNIDVRPVLARSCFPCHGPGDEAQLAALQLGDPEQATATWKFIEAGHPGIDSPLAGAIIGPDPADQATLRRWTAEGARHDSHWAFQSLNAGISLPAVRERSWPRNKIDHFVQASIEARFQSPPTGFDPADWLERSTRVLLGRAPTREDLEAFERDVRAHPQATLEETAERLLASPAFGKHMAASWLDAAGVGEAVSSPASFAPYRDWLTEAFNRNAPFDELLREQLAGDLLDNPRPEQVLATAFLRLHQHDKRPRSSGPDPEACLRNEPVNPKPEPNPATHSTPGTPATWRVDTLGSTMLGLTLECARCHDHPHEPVTQRDYHSLHAFFNSINESGRSDDGSGVIPAPTLLLPDGEQRELLYTLTLREADTENLLRQARLDGEEAFHAWLANPDKLPVLADLVGAWSFDQTGSMIPNRALPGGSPADRGTLLIVPGFTGQAVRFDGTTPVRISDPPELERWSAWTCSLILKDPVQAPEPVVLLSHSSGPGPVLHGIDLRLTGGHLTARLARDWPGNAIGVRTTEPAIPADQWSLLTCTYDGSSRAAGLRLYLNGRRLATETLADHLWKSTLMIHEDTSPPLLLGARPGDRGFTGGLLDDLQIFSRALTPLEVENLRDPGALAKALTGEPTDALRNYYFSSIHPESRRLASQLAAERRETVHAEDPILEVSVMRELPAPRPTILPGTSTPVARSTPGFLPPLDAPGSKIQDPSSRLPNRLDLARWITRADHPLTARVVVNRLWARFFGEGLVARAGAPPADFGLAGPAPTDPELLDWLARDFISHGWDTKRLCRQILLSRTYQTKPTRPSASP